MTQAPPSPSVSYRARSSGAPVRPLAPLVFAALALGFSACSSSDDGGNQPSPATFVPSRSQPIQLSADGSLMFVVNKVGGPAVASGLGSLSIVRVRQGNGADDGTLLAEIPVGNEPFSVSLNEEEDRVYVSNGADSTISVIDLGDNAAGPYQFLTEIVVGSEPRGTAVSGERLYVANYGDGTMTTINTESLLVQNTLDLQFGGESVDHPYGLIALENGDVWITDFFARARRTAGVDEVEGFDNGKEGRVALVRGGVVQSLAFMSPMADAGFTADRTAFDPANGAVNDTFAAPTGVDATAVPQGAFFNQLSSFGYDVVGRRLYLPTIGAQPAPPVRFNVNIQALVGVIDVPSASEDDGLHVNLNAEIRDNFGSEPAPLPPFSDPVNRLDRAFAGDVVAMDVVDDTMLFASRAGGFALRATLNTDGTYDLVTDDRGAVLRIPTTNMPTGVVISSDGTRAYVASDLVGEVTAIDLTDDTVALTIQTAATPTDPQTRRELLGKLAFFTGMGLAADVDASTDPRTVDTHRFRNMASDNNWSSCASCHPGGMADGVTWIFPTGPRQSISLEGFFAAGSTVLSSLATTDQKVSNWNAVRGSITDFNNNARNVQGGFGFTPMALLTIDAGDEPADVADSGLVFNHGPRMGVSNALDFMTEWVASLRVLNRPTGLDQDALGRGRTLFSTSCASCHGGTKWTRGTRVLDLALWPDPAFTGGLPATSNLQNPAATVISAFDSNNDTVFDTNLVETQVGMDTLDLTNGIEIRGLGGSIGLGSAGAAASFVSPSLFNLRNTAPYGHHGRAQSISGVFDSLAAGGLGHTDFGLTAQELSDILVFIEALDDDQPTIP